MAEKKIDRPAPGDSYELDLDDTVSQWDELIEEAVAAVDKTIEKKAKDKVPARGAPAEEAAAEKAAAEEAAAGEAPPAAESAPITAIAGSVEDEVKSLRDRLVRTLADFDNFRKRAEREKAAIQRFALFDTLKDFLEVNDNLERALAASGSAEELKRGVEMIARQLSDLLRRHGAEPIQAVGQPFDPALHEAVTYAAAAEVDQPTVIAELQRGYRLHDRLLRPALVSVAMPMAKPVATPTAGAEEEANTAQEAGEPVGQASEGD